MKPKFTAEHEAYIKGVSTPEGEPFEWGVNWPSLQKLLPSKPARTLDFGCSGGYLLPHLPGEVREGCDSDAGALAIAAALYPGYKYFEWDGVEALVAAEPYDLILAKLALHLVPDLVVVAKNFSKILNPGGAIVISYPHPLRTMQYGFGTYEAMHTYMVRLSYVDLEVTAVHRSLSGIVQPFLDVGMVLTGLDEVRRPESLLIKAEDALSPNRLNLAFRQQ